MAETTVTTPAVSGAPSDSANAGAPAEGVRPVSAEDFEGFKKFMNKELQNLRKSQDAPLSRIEEIAKVLEELRPVKPASGPGKSDEKDLRTAEIEREVKALKEENARVKQDRQSALVKSAVSDATQDVSPAHRDVLMEALRAKAKIETVDGEDVVALPGEDGPQRLTRELVRKVYGDAWYPSSGKPGSGIRDAGTASGGNGIDIDRAMKDAKYFRENEKAVLAELDRQKSLGR